MAKHIVKVNEPPKCEQCGTAIKGAHMILSHSNGAPSYIFCGGPCLEAWVTKKP